jgi:hypothetical protein
MRGVNALAVVLLAITPLQAADVRNADLDRFQQFEALFGKAMRQALAGGDPVDVGLLSAALSGTPQADGALEGDWLCRWMKLGDTVPLVVYSNFECRITAEGDGWRLEKLTGSQRFEGSLTRTPGGWVYTGVAHVGETPATDYVGLPPDDQTPVEPNQTTAQVGLFELVSDDRARLLLPDPILESDFDVIAFSR